MSVLWTYRKCEASRISYMGNVSLLCCRLVVQSSFQLRSISADASQAATHPAHTSY